MKKPLALASLAVGTLALGTLAVLSAQAPATDTLFKAMHDELDRATKLTLANLEAPYFVEYVIAEEETFSVNASLGGLLSRRRDRFRLPDVKLRTNALERDLAGSGTYAEERPLNLDPGLLALGKFLLATTKDQAHRVYLRDGIFAEVTLRYHAGAWEPWPWTYADYRLPEVHAFLRQARDLYRQRLRDRAAGE